MTPWVVGLNTYKGNYYYSSFFKAIILKHKNTRKFLIGQCKSHGVFTVG